MKQILVDNHTIQNNNEKNGQIALKSIFRFCNTFEKVTENLGFHKTLKTIDLQKNLYTALPEATINNVTHDNLLLVDPNFTPSPLTQVELNQSIRKNSFTLPFKT